MRLNGKLFVNYNTISTDSIIPLIKESESLPEMWSDEFRARHYPSQKSTQNLSFVWTPILDRKAFVVYNNKELLSSKIGNLYTEITEQVLQNVPGKVIRGALVRMFPGAKIPYHLDGSHELWSQCHRLHLPAQTEQEVTFHYKIEDQQITKHLEKDILVEIDNFIPHGVTHNGNKIRYHLLYDVLPETYSGDYDVIEHSDEIQFQQNRLSEVDDRLKFSTKIDPNIYKL